ncbi:MAG: T9SS type A sorting domain-containing protein, partial [Bacteroidota bacterium]
NVPSSYSLDQNYPNPFNPATTISYQLPTASSVTLKVYDVLGREVATLVDEFKNAGNYKIIFNVKTRHSVSLHSGVYFYRLTTPSSIITKKMLLLK